MQRTQYDRELFLRAKSRINRRVSYRRLSHTTNMQRIYSREGSRRAREGQRTPV